MSGWASRLAAASVRALSTAFWSSADLAYAACGAVRRGMAEFAADPAGALGVAALKVGAVAVEQRAPLAAASIIVVGASFGWNATANAPTIAPAFPAKATPTKFEHPPAKIRVRQRTPAGPPAPAALQNALSDLAARYGENVGVAVVDVSEGWVASVKGQVPFPQQSVSKLWVAITAMDLVDQGRMRLDQGALMTDADRSVFFQPITYRIDEDGYQTTVEELLEKALITSDNAANDKLMGMVGGPAAIAAMFESKALDGLALAEDEKHLQARIAGMTWTPELRPYGAFEEARGRLPREVRQAALDAYLARPYDGATPVGIAQALAALQRGELLSPASTEVILGAMSRARTGPRRLAGGLPDGWKIAHKTGTGQDWRGASVGINDVGLITAPDGRTYAVAVMLAHTRKPVPARLEFMQAVTRAVVESWRSDRRMVASLRGPESSLGD